MAIQRIKGGVWTILFIVFGVFISHCFASGGSKTLSLSQALSRVDLFSELTPGERDLLKTAARLRQGKTGEQIIHQGKARDKMFIILEGRAEVRVNHIPIVTLPGQSLVGEIEFLDMLPASADVFLLEDTPLIELNYDALTRLMENQPRMGYVIMRKIAQIEAMRLRKSSQK
jgi:CRP/FNR family transcriptional regulator, cyclic AMP receptor protein